MKSIITRISEELHKQLKAAAKKDNRSVNGAVTMLIQKYVKEMR